MSVRRCIYCLYEKDVNDFNREHVLPDAFGRYENGPSRLNCVCTECNSYFGGNLDLVLARGTFEGLQRFGSGVMVADHAALADIASRLPEIVVSEEGPYYGATATVALALDSSLKAIPLPQIGFRCRGSTVWTFVRYETVFQADWVPPKYDEIRFLGVTDDQLRAVTIHLCELGLSVPELTPECFHGPMSETLELEVFWRITEAVRRAVAKIAFNYAASSEGADFVLGPSFDGIRRYIRYAESGGRKMVAIAQHPPDSTGSFRGHYITLQLKQSLRVESHISLFNTFTYTIILTGAYHGLYRPLAHGLYFDPWAREVSTISHTSSIWLS